MNAARELAFSSISCVGLALAGAACMVHSTDVPPLAGPSEFALSFRLAALPDTISQDGVSQSTITLSAYDAAGRPASGRSFRLDMFVGEAAVDYGTISSRSLVTRSDGKATAVYTAPPPAPPDGDAGTCGGLPGTCITVSATPVGSGFNHGTVTQRVDLRLVPLAVIVPSTDPDAPDASFVYSPPAPRKGDRIQFNASTSRASRGRAIVQYTWSWGDGEGASRSHPFEDHDYPEVGRYPVDLTVVDDAGSSASSRQVIRVIP
jgi:hypothetical protein